MSMLVTSLAEVWIETIRPSERDVYVWVTSLAEVWIETPTRWRAWMILFVTSLAEVWIETHYPQKHTARYASLPLRKCGLKLLISLTGIINIIVTSLAEVWIETMIKWSDSEPWLMSLPLRKCGLKLGIQCIRWGLMSSLPLRKCGLKQQSLDDEMSLLLVTSLAEVWIETIPRSSYTLESVPSLPLRKCGLKQKSLLDYFGVPVSLPLRKCGLKQ